MKFSIFLLSFVYASFLEWWLHKYMMHRVFWGFRYPKKAHAEVHHGTFRADGSYRFTEPHPHTKEDFWLIPMKWWNGPVLVAVGSLPSAALFASLGDWTLALCTTWALALYYLLYEGIHWCMHLPEETLVRRMISAQPSTLWIFFLLDRHHFFHHANPATNFNVVLPLADLCCGTLRTGVKV